MGLSPILTVCKVPGKVGLKIGDLVESNEAFAAQMLAVIVKLRLDPSRVRNNQTWSGLARKGSSKVYSLRSRIAAHNPEVLSLVEWFGGSESQPSMWGPLTCTVDI
jgi:hypothetical protein